ncbi:phosphatidylinositol 3- and 4-kinase [Babesia caballi]|uniref:1-phosphatidylinositol 4-kinase n=1 Tax=Babesia caballi TaxID=5871 RepID=A0AAV4LSU3_BABCB|nr:phosphatidylinositol 3- and 4-kinase [Babesia caballi]
MDVNVPMPTTGEGDLSAADLSFAAPASLTDALGSHVPGDDNYRRDNELDYDREGDISPPGHPQSEEERGETSDDSPRSGYSSDASDEHDNFDGVEIDGRYSESADGVDGSDSDFAGRPFHDADAQRSMHSEVPYYNSEHEDDSDAHGGEDAPAGNEGDVDEPVFGRDEGEFMHEQHDELLGGSERQSVEESHDKSADGESEDEELPIGSEAEADAYITDTEKRMSDEEPEPLAAPQPDDRDARETTMQPNYAMSMYSIQADKLSGSDPLADVADAMADAHLTKIEAERNVDSFQLPPASETHVELGNKVLSEEVSHVSSTDYERRNSTLSSESAATSESTSRHTASDGASTIVDGEKSSKSSSSSKKSSRKRMDRMLLGTSENPIDVTDLTVDSGSLLQLYQNDYFDAYMHMYHLYHKKEAGVHEYLVNLLYSKRTDQEAMFYLPQLCQLSISKYGKSSLHRFLLDKASTSMPFALKLSWFYQAIISDQASKLGHLAQKMTQETEMAVVNCKLISPVANCLPPVEDRELKMCSKGLFVRRAIIRAIRAGHENSFNVATEMELLEPPQMPSQLNHADMFLVCPHSKVKLPTPFARIGNPLELETYPFVDCPDEMQYELERLMMKQRRLDYFNMLSNFVKLCMDISKMLTTVPKRDARPPMLKLFAKSMNEWMLLQRCTVAAYEESFSYRGLSLPMCKMGRDKRTNIPFQFLRIVEDEIKIFLSKKRAPFVFYFEIANLDEDVSQISRGEDPDALASATFRDLHVYEAIVKDLVASGLLDVADVACIRNPLECIRYTMGMLPPDVLERYNERRQELKSGPADTWRGGNDPAAAAILSAVQEFTVGSKSVNDDCSGDSSPRLGASQSAMETKHPLLEQMSPSEAKALAFPELIVDKKKRLRQNSPYGCLESWNVRAVIIKGGDDLRQEYMVNQLLTLFSNIFAQAQLPLWLKPIEILVTGPNCGIIEFLHDTCSIDVVKRKFNVESIAKAFERIYADNLFEARKNFIESHAAYSVVSYLLQVRDRHNGNILLDSEGHVIHIDYGFCLSNTPGNISFETSPFKLTKEYVDVIGGEDSDNFDYFKALVIRGLLEARKHMDRIVLLVEMMTDAHKMPCFAAGTAYTMDMFRDRFMLHLSEDVCIDRIVAMIEESLNNFTTIQYDNFQRLTNGIK